MQIKGNDWRFDNFDLIVIKLPQTYKIIIFMIDVGKIRVWMHDSFYYCLTLFNNDSSISIWFCMIFSMIDGCLIYHQAEVTCLDQIENQCSSLSSLMYSYYCTDFTIFGAFT